MPPDISEDFESAPPRVSALLPPRTRGPFSLARPLALIALGVVLLMADWAGATFRWYERFWPIEVAGPGGVSSDPPPAQLRWTEPGPPSAARTCDLPKAATNWIGRAVLTEDGITTVQVSSDLFLRATADSTAPRIRYGALIRFSGRFMSDLVGCPAELPSIQTEHTRVLLGRRDDQPVRVFLFQFSDVRQSQG